MIFVKFRKKNSNLLQLCNIENVDYWSFSNIHDFQITRQKFDETLKNLLFY